MTPEENVRYHTQQLAKILIDFKTDTPSSLTNERNQEYVDAARERLATAKECERCMLIAENDSLRQSVMELKRTLKTYRQRYRPGGDRCTTCGMALNDDGACNDCFLSRMHSSV